ncbi:Nitrilase family, member 2 [Seminavis robusta]|uniref:Nitrilase family, member 2 n=1 Tax=Seminavis robusta TaxID=568900 RepID=A0A9N8DZP5_9STRA|nr:Nitrilase family, member 2 [Seminavis robusta]|eukprot:Sro394_g133740.1 Nitrilase family, member 2 (343) ;mRNA; f:3217-4418
MIFKFQGEPKLTTLNSSMDNQPSKAAPEKIGNYWVARSKHTKRLLPETFEPTQYSVICGRTKFCFDSVGNRRFKVTAKMFLQEYSEAKTKAEKSKIVTRVFNLVKESSPEGAFVTFENGRWYECSERISREKIGALFRDMLPQTYQSSAKAKQARKDSLGSNSSRSGSPESIPMPSLNSTINNIITQSNRHSNTINTTSNGTSLVAAYQNVQPQHLALASLASADPLPSDNTLPVPAFASGPMSFPSFFDVDASNFVPLERAETQCPGVTNMMNMGMGSSNVNMGSSNVNMGNINMGNINIGNMGYPNIGNINSSNQWFFQPDQNGNFKNDNNSNSNNNGSV